MEHRCDSGTRSAMYTGSALTAPDTIFSLVIATGQGGVVRIGFLTPEYPPSGGIGTSVRGLAHALSRQGHRVWVVVPTHSGAHSGGFDDEGVTVRTVPVRDRGSPTANRRRLHREVVRLVDEEGLEVVESSDWRGLSAGMDPGCGVVVRCHGSATYFASLLGERPPRALCLAETVAVWQATALAAVSRFTAEKTKELFHLRRKVSVIPNAVDTERFQPAKEAELDHDLVLYVGTVMRKKGVIDLCTAFSQVVDVIPSARLAIIGRDTDDHRTGRRSTWELCVESLSAGALRRTDYLGQQPHEILHGFVRAASVCVFPSYAEAMPVAWLEALACGKAVIGYDHPWAREIVSQLRSGILVPSGDTSSLANAIVGVVGNEELRRLLGATAREIARREFSLEVAVNRTIELYERAGEAHDRRRFKGWPKW